MQDSKRRSNVQTLHRDAYWYSSSRRNLEIKTAGKRMVLPLQLDYDQTLIFFLKPSVGGRTAIAIPDHGADDRLLIPAHDEDLN
jgi:hypothetical protein